MEFFNSAIEVLQTLVVALGQARVDEDLKGKFYTFNVKIDDVWQGDTPGLIDRKSVV